MLKRVLVPLDGSSLAESALDYALKIVQPDGVLTLVSAIQIPEMPIYDLYPVPMPVTQTKEELNSAIPGAKAYLERVAERLCEACDLTVNIIVDVGDPAALIVDVATHDQSDAIVMSTHGRSGLGRWFFGSVTNKVLMGANCPVLVVPPKNRLQHVETAAKENVVPA
ncbi:MAG: universal stress protein [Anaerolineae bacterium]